MQEVECLVERVARLVLHAQALADRLDGLSEGAAQPGSTRLERVLRLRQAVALGGRAIQEAAGRKVERRRSDRRLSHRERRSARERRAAPPVEGGPTVTAGASGAS